MDKWGKERPPQRGHDYPSFSSTLLDTIYRSIDESDAGRGGAVAAADPSPIAFFAAAPRRPAPAYSPHSAVAPKERTVARPPRRLQPISTSSSSDNSSYGGFSSSSEPESAASHRGRIRPIRTLTAASARSAPCPPPPLPPQQHPAPSPPAAHHHHHHHHHREKSKSSSIRSKLRDLGRSRAPASPGARLASLLNSIFATAARRPRKPKAPPAADDSACSTASSHSRSCLVKTPSSRRGTLLEDEGSKRSVRFHPVSVIVGEDLRPCGQKIVRAGDRREATEEDKRRRSTAAEGKGREEERRRVVELLRRYEVEEDEDGMSDSSSDLFELENLTTAVGGGCGGGYRDELPVYETTHPGTNRAISRVLVQ